MDSMDIPCDTDLLLYILNTAQVNFLNYFSIKRVESEMEKVITRRKYKR